jgi:hypothetical protein
MRSVAGTVSAVLNTPAGSTFRFSAVNRSRCDFGKQRSRSPSVGCDRKFPYAASGASPA